MKDSRVDVFSSENRANIPVYPHDVFTPTDAGTAQLRGGATRLPAEALGILVLLDGKATVGDLEQKAGHITQETFRDLLRMLLGAGFIRAATVEETEGLDFSAFFEATRDLAEPSPGTQASADRESQTGGLKLESDGYYVSIARQAVRQRSPGAGERLAVFLVEDDDDVAVLVSRLLEGAGFEMSRAAGREGIVARLRQKPMPNLVILDVSLPDANGFEVLQRLKLHPLLKAVPVIMLTAEATREAVMRGLAGGADGYITKPFSRRALLAGVKAVLGLPEA
jgi:two-component system OmpR family response regulator